MPMYNLGGVKLALASNIKEFYRPKGPKKWPKYGDFEENKLFCTSFFSFSHLREH